MYPNAKIEFIKDAGACIASRRIIDGAGYLKWAIREASVNPVDNCWRFFSAADDAEYINNTDNLVVCDYNTVAEIEPAIIAIYLFPVGSDLQLVVEHGKPYFVDNITGKKVDL
jgi:hypothetical protein